MSASERAKERGMALAAAMFALVIIGALVAANFFTGRLEQQSARNSVFARQASEGAETGIREALATVQSQFLASLPAGGTPFDLGSDTIAPGVRIERQVVRLTRTVFLLKARGTRLDADGGALAERQLGMLVRLLPSPDGGLPSVARFRQRWWVQLY